MVVVVQQVRATKNISYAEAVKEVDKGKKQSETTMNSERLVLFIAYVINCTEQAKTRTEKIKIIVKAAATFLSLRLSVDKVYAHLSSLSEPATFTIDKPSLVILHWNAKSL